MIDELPQSLCVLLAGTEVVLGSRKSLELIMRKVCSLFGGETAGQQDIVKIKAGGKTRQKMRQRGKNTEMFLLFNLQTTRDNQKTYCTVSGARIERSCWDGEKIIREIFGEK